MVYSQSGCQTEVTLACEVDCSGNYIDEGRTKWWDGLTSGKRTRYYSVPCSQEDAFWMEKMH